MEYNWHAYKKFYLVGYVKQNPQLHINIGTILIPNPEHCSENLKPLLIERDFYPDALTFIHELDIRIEEGHCIEVICLQWLTGHGIQVNISLTDGKAEFITGLRPQSQGCRGVLMTGKEVIMEYCAREYP